MSPDVTRQKEMNSYKDELKGNELLIYRRYSYILVIFYITMMYGIGMPILFPLAAISFIVLWVVERYDVAKNVRQPPTTRYSFLNIVMHELRWGPLLLLINSYWIVTN